MKKLVKRKKASADDRPNIKIKLDYKTLVTVRSMAAFEKWKLLFPTAIILE